MPPFAWSEPSKRRRASQATTLPATPALLPCDGTGLGLLRLERHAAGAGHVAESGAVRRGSGTALERCRGKHRHYEQRHGLKGVDGVVRAWSFRSALRGRKSAARVHVDPVCGMKVAAISPYRARHGRRTILLCSAGCLARFVREPDAFASARS
jgi:YHS domain-containing protein